MTPSCRIRGGLAVASVLAALVFTGRARADELIRAANNQQSLTLGLAHIHEGEQARDNAGAVVLNEESGPQLQLGYGTTRTRTLFGVPGFYTDLRLLLGLGTLAYAGPSYAANTGVAGPNGGNFNHANETVRLRVGRSLELGSGGRYAVTPYLGLGQQAWLSSASSQTRATVYNHYSGELGLLAQAAVTHQIVLGLDASAAREFAAIQVDQQFMTWPHRGTGTSFGLYLDNRTYSDWHQRLEIRQDSLRYGEPATVANVFEPRRSSGLAVQLTFGTELDLYKGLFY